MLRPIAFAWWSVRTRARDSLPISRPLRFLVAAASMAVEGAGGRELAELVADHVLGDEHRNVLVAVVDAEGDADELRQDRRTARPGLDHVLAAGAARGFCLLQQIAVDERTFPN